MMPVIIKAFDLMGHDIIVEIFAENESLKKK